MTLKLKLQISNFSQRLHTEVLSTTVGELSDSPFPNYRAKYVKNVEKGLLGRVFMVIMHRLNIYLKTWFWYM